VGLGVQLFGRPTNAVKKIMKMITQIINKNTEKKVQIRAAFVRKNVPPMEFLLPFMHRKIIDQVWHWQLSYRYAIYYQNTNNSQVALKNRFFEVGFIVLNGKPWFPFSLIVKFTGKNLYICHWIWLSLSCEKSSWFTSNTSSYDQFHLKSVHLCFVSTKIIFFLLQFSLFYSYFFQKT
jgi:hypothetical protein